MAFVSKKSVFCYSGLGDSPGDQDSLQFSDWFDDCQTAIETAKGFIHRAITDARTWEIGHGHGPIDHLGWGDTRATGPLP